jgi:hypothetical protein
MKWNLKCETSLVAERSETRQHFFYFFAFFLSLVVVRPQARNINNSVTWNALYSAYWQNHCGFANTYLHFSHRPDAAGQSVFDSIDADCGKRVACKLQQSQPTPLAVQKVSRCALMDVVQPRKGVLSALV